jgi:hypothetical protein
MPQCKLDCCIVPVLPKARIRRSQVKAHEASRFNHNSSYWKRVKAAVSDLTKDEIRLVSHVQVLELPTDDDHIPSPLEEKLEKFVRSSLLRTAPVDQLLRSALLHGPPGTGKTHAAKAIAARFGLKFISVQYSDIHSKWVGESGKVWAAILRLAWKHQPALLFPDECEYLLGSRESASDSHDAKVTNEILTALQGSEDSQPGLIIMCCTNQIGKMEPAAISRFGKNLIEVSHPDAAMVGAAWRNTLADAHINLTEAELGRLQEYPLPDLRFIKGAVLEWEELETEDTSELLRIVDGRSCEPESDVELDDMPLSQHRWRAEAPLYIKSQLPSFCTYISKRLHRAIPACKGGECQWLQILDSNCASISEQAGSAPFELRLGEPAHSWCIQSAQSITNVVINFNVQVEAPQAEMKAMHEQIAAMQEEIRILKRKRVDEEAKEDEESPICSKMHCYVATTRKQTGKASAAALNKSTEGDMDEESDMDESSGSDTNESDTPKKLKKEKREKKKEKRKNNKNNKKKKNTKKKKQAKREKKALDDDADLSAGEDDDKEVEDVDEELPPICSKKRCTRTTVQMKNGKWRKQCARCLTP